MDFFAPPRLCVRSVVFAASALLRETGQYPERDLTRGREGCRDGASRRGAENAENQMDFFAPPRLCVRSVLFPISAFLRETGQYPERDLTRGREGCRDGASRRGAENAEKPNGFLCASAPLREIRPLSDLRVSA